MADAFAAADEIAGGGDGEADQRNIGVARLAWGLADIAKFEFDPPGLTVRLHTLADELAADFHQEARNTEGAQARGAEIDSVAFGDGGEIEGDAAGLEGAAVGGIDLDVAPAA